MNLQREALARQIITRMRRNPDEMITLPSGETLPLWKIAGKAMDGLPAPVRALLDAQGKPKRRTLRQALARVLRRLRKNDGWIDPRDGLPAASEDGVLSELVLVKRMDETTTAVLLFGSPVGSHRWIFNKDRPDEHYVHVLDIDGWMEMRK